ncbi:MAG: biopolymer transporter ExbD [Crocinitomicaceae bacterium]|jgi:biopolymer transport protein ExbD|nr:biopolymer transporter ExbD [Crocinitomicaceae bacterium]MCF8443667.1 biopolymer transporter ExbD [Crocinitomicaceae bacterium]
MNFNTRNKVKVEGGMASMTDLVFLLLIFFIIMSLMANNQTPIDLPKPDESLKPVKDPVEATVVITENNQYVVMPGGDMAKPMEFDQIKQLAAGAVQKTGKQKLRIAGHKEASYEAVFRVLALAQANQWDPVLAYDK